MTSFKGHPELGDQKGPTGDRFPRAKAMVHLQRQQRLKAITNEAGGTDFQGLQALNSKGYYKEALGDRFPRTLSTLNDVVCHKKVITVRFQGTVRRISQTKIVRL